MAIAGHEILWVDVPLSEPFQLGSGRPAAELRHVVLRMWTDDGIEGIGWYYSYSNTMLAVLGAAIGELATLLHGREPLGRVEISNYVARASQWTGGGGLGNLATAVIDIALCDILGKVHRLPVYQLLGAQFTASVPTYASHRLWRNYSIDELGEVASSLRADGFRMLKFRIGGSRNMDDERSRIRAVREAVGSTTALMIDVNQSWDVGWTRAMAPSLEESNVYWLEDPIRAHDFEAYSLLVQVLSTNVTHGENLFDWRLFHRMAQMQAMDIAMIDLHRVGGIENFVRAAHVCEAAYRPVVTHLSPEVNVHLGAAVQNCALVEYMDWSSALFNESLSIDDEGCLVVPQEPGFGVTLNEDVVRRGIRD